MFVRRKAKGRKMRGGRERGMDEKRRLALYPLPKDAFFSPASPLAPTDEMFRKTTNSREKSQESKGET